MAIKGVSDDELANLSDEERAALEEGEEQEAEEAADLKAIAQGDEGPGDEEDDDDEDDVDDKAKKAAAAKDEKAEKAADKKADDKAAADAVAAEEARRTALSEEARVKEDEAKAAEAKKAEDDAAAKAAAAKDAEAEEEEIQRPRLPRYQVKAVEKYDEQVKALNDADSAAEETFRAGDLELKDLLATHRANAAKLTDLREAKLRADLATEFNENAGKTEWLGDVADFFARTKVAEGIDYNKPLMNAAIDTALKALGNDPANKQRSSTWFLREAHKAVKAELGIVTPAAKNENKGAEKAAADAAAKKAKLAGRKPELAVVKDVGSLPNAGDDDAAGGDPEFAALDKLNGIEYEDALAAMPTSKQDRYLRRAG
jgi:hypothetical protein